ncbi:WD40 repeat domain-containing protein [Leptolyngbya sp. AN03gr2]|uniref:WD40 repeat domain-containing protein n=1 Tax=unclassified Leptolyngbya TaxID=2650499 RepID=UPI003D315D56
MSLLLGQLVYTSFAKVGFRALSSAAISPEIQQAFIDQIVHQHWDAYNPPESSYRAVYLYRISENQTLFGWLYNDGADDLGRNHIPYFVCYYYAGELQPEHLDVIFTCLARGAATYVDRQVLPEQIESVVIANYETYESAQMGVSIPQELRDQTRRSLNQNKLFKLFVSGTFATSIDSYLEELSLKVIANTSGGRGTQVSVLEPATYEQILLSKAKLLAPPKQAAPIKLGLALSLFLLLSAAAGGAFISRNVPKQTEQQPTVTQPVATEQPVARSNPFNVSKTLNSSAAWSVLLDGQTIISTTEDCSIKFWNADTGTVTNTISYAHYDTIRSLTITPDRILVSGSADRSIKLWNLQNNQPIQTLDHGSPVWSVATNKDTLFSVGEDGNLKLWSLSKRTLFKAIPAHDGRIFSVVVSPDGKTIATGGLDRTIKLWNAQTGDLIRTITGHKDAIRALAFSPDGQTLVSGSWDKTIKQWNWQTGELIQTLEGHTSRVVAIAFTPDGQRLISGSVDNTVKLWSLQDRKELQTLSSHKDWVLAVATDGDRIVSGSKDQTVRIWKN